MMVLRKIEKKVKAVANKKQALQREKQRTLALRPTGVQAVTDYVAYCQLMDKDRPEMERINSELAVLEAEEKALIQQIDDLKLERAGLIKNLQRQRANRCETIDALMAQYIRIGVRLNRAKDFKARQVRIIDIIVYTLEPEILELSNQIRNINEED